MDPLYQEGRAYPFADNVAFRYMIAPENTEYLPTDILVSDNTLNEGKGGYKRLSFRDPDTGNNTYWNLKAAVNAGLFRFAWEDRLTLEMYLHGGLNTVFGAYGGVDVLGFDGFYGAGVSFDVYDIVTFRFGFHHFSGHWGDEALNDFYSMNSNSNYSALTEYTRNNSWLFGISIKPATPVETLRDLLPAVDLVLVMSVEPGFGGQAFIPESLDRIRELRAMLDAKGLDADIEVDGGIYHNNVGEVLAAGANVIVSGSGVYKGNIAENTERFMEILKSYE